MILSHSKQFIFIHIYKNAGTSIQAALKKWNSLEQNLLLKGLRKITKIEIYGLGYMSRLKMMDSLKNSHTNLSDLEKYLPADLFQSYFKFAFVRNPWSWQVSLYEFGKQDTKHFQHELLNKFDFRDYISWRVENEVKFQTDFILNNKGDLGMNYLGRFEELYQDFECLCNHLNIQAILPKKNVSLTKDYRTYYDEKTAQIIGEVFKKDIENFGYDFDGISSTIVPKFPVQQLINCPR
jgi:hypothetical protein